MIASAVALYYDCGFPLWMHYLLIVYMVSFLVLFGNFYMQAYLAKGRRMPQHLSAAASDRNINGNAATTTFTEQRPKTMDFILSHDSKKIK